MRKHGHVIGLNLRHGGNGGEPPITIDGVPFHDVGNITVDAVPGKGIRVTVTFDASHLTGVIPTEAEPDTSVFDTSMTYQNAPEETQ